MQTCFRLQCFRDCVCCVSAPLYVPYGSLWCLHNPTDVESQCEEDKPNRERFLSLVAASVVGICLFYHIIFEIWLAPRVGQPVNTTGHSSLLSAKDVLLRGSSVPQQQKFHADDSKSVWKLVRSSVWSMQQLYYFSYCLQMTDKRQTVATVKCKCNESA